MLGHEIGVYEIIRGCWKKTKRVVATCVFWVVDSEVAMIFGGGLVGEVFWCSRWIGTNAFYLMGGRAEGIDRWNWKDGTCEDK
jgi:hypothetical protein